MSTRDDQYTRRRLTGSYITSVVSITLVLFMLGLLGLIVINARRLSDHIKENIGFEIIMNEGVKEAGILQLQKTLDASPYVKSTEYITREEATEMLTKDLGEDFIKWLGEEQNPLMPSIDVRFKAAWANNDSLAVIEKKILENSNVKELFYQKSLVHLINKNINRIGVIILGFSVLLLVIAIALINNTIRLSVYSKRFLIRSMQLVGATENFIRKPFIWSSIFQGIIGAIIALLMLTGILYLSVQNIPELALLHEMNTVLIFYAAVFVLGMAISGVSTYFAIGKYLRAKTDKLFN
ncbi:MAG: permease-like cell division protein FtsX [Bacteroidetes bacterium]|nr:permease-like cell division protein FtsX [Bacteroidales bacterium]MBU1009242.1 permease-like cell division protein FtsX [Bacteroidota bacterium]